ncbi:hypothetical protein ACHHYP_06069 [Achlya hypogyna]|uniref:SAM-dependent MTase RsmB/NOP-type domain-containing protein n=1 Tax=Achlya hypogyna TaxID=1202772 RepID=A0A1V9ZN98_ACHHY|nr:hypothetical protein ACHHYP_06069 [Achlya hypogyna]
MELPPAFTTFLDEHGIDRAVYAVHPQATPRYVRTKDSSITLEQLKDEFPSITPVPWAKSFYMLPSSVPLSSSASYANGLIYGMEASSGFAVSALNLQPGDHVLDLCCAPGAKLTMLGDILGKHGSVTGVDFSKNRIAACRSLVHKYGLVHPATDKPWRCRLFHADGREFSVGAPTGNETLSTAGVLEIILDTAEVASRSTKSIARKRMNKSARARYLKQQKEQNRSDLTSGLPAKQLYDKVLVDAECTHDGSLRHLAKLKTGTEWQHYLDKYLSPTHVADILQLQADLIRNGFRLLAPGGRMVYSTCSLSLKQNEDIVAAFLNDTPTAVLEPMDTNGVPCQPGNIPNTVRFTPLHHVGGLFVALFSKASEVPSKRQKTK